MYLKELEIFGFKSFPEKVTLRFEPGITVIVGPNGCGKSNVLDAIRWALGEQSPKSLRGNKMEDVIFNGTQNQPPLNYAEVTLLFSNEDKVLNLGFEEISITRRLFRSGESEYLINKTPARLKDIQELLMPVGLGEGSYSFVAQGSIDNLLNYKPEEKRIIFDEAAGILQYKEKKREALRKLEEVDNNLLRIEDIIAEVKRQRDSLQRQVERARKYQEIHNQLKEIESRIAAINLVKLNREKLFLSEEIDNFIAQEKEKETLLNSFQERAKQIEDDFSLLRKSLQEGESKIITLASEISNYHNKIELNQQRIGEYKSRLQDIAQSRTSYSQRKSQQEERIRLLKEEIVSLDNNFTTKRNRISEAEKKIGEKLEENKARNLFIKETNQKIFSREEERISFSNNLIDIQNQLNNFNARKTRLLKELARSDSELREFETRFSQINEQLQGFQSRVEEFRKEKEIFLNKINEQRQRFKEFTELKLEKEKEFVAVSSQLAFLKELKVKYEDFPQTQEITVVFDEAPYFLPSVIVAKVDKDSVVREGSFFKIRTRAKIIPQKIEQLEERLAHLNREINDLQNKIEEASQESFLLEEEIRKREENFQKEEKEFLRIKEVEKSFRENLARLKEEKELVELELKETEEEIKSFYSKEKEVKENLLAKENEIKQLQELVEKTQQEIKDNETQIKDLEIEIARLKAELNSLEEEKKVKLNTLEIFLKDLGSLEKEIANLEVESLNLQEKLSWADKEIQDFLAQIQLKEKEKEAKEEELQVLKKKQVDLEAEKNNVLEKLSLVQNELEELRKNIYELRLKLQNVGFAQDKIISELNQTYSLDLKLEDLLNSSEDEASLEKLQLEADNLKKRLKYLGSVNLGALEEYEALEERFKFLDAQRQDLLSSKESLKKAINKINKTSSEMFIQTFQRIKEEFKGIFRFLFGGGKAEIFLLDEENPLESGVEIMVQPPGKKLQSVSLLSGGEKALTAVALIFSIFKIKPSALCILDEIDAPLDEANVDRFNYLLSEFSKTSQFILVSHNKKTIAKASVLYGVTMQEKGISKIVSVKLTEKAVSP